MVALAPPGEPQVDSKQKRIAVDETVCPYSGHLYRDQQQPLLQHEMRYDNRSEYRSIREKNNYFQPRSRSETRPRRLYNHATHSIIYEHDDEEVPRYNKSSYHTNSRFDHAGNWRGVGGSYDVTNPRYAGRDVAPSSKERLSRELSSSSSSSSGSSASVSAPWSEKLSSPPAKPAPETPRGRGRLKGRGEDGFSSSLSPAFKASRVLFESMTDPRVTVTEGGFPHASTEAPSGKF